MAAANKFNIFVLDLTNKVHNLGSDTLKVMLSNSAPVATNTVKANITQIANGNGYTTDGSTATLTSNTQTSGTEKLILQSVTFTASGAVGPFRYAILQNNTTASGSLILWWDYGSSVTLASGDTFTVSFDGSAGVMTLA